MSRTIAGIVALALGAALSFFAFLCVVDRSGGEDPGEHPFLQDMETELLERQPLAAEHGEPPEGNGSPGRAPLPESRGPLPLAPLAGTLIESSGAVLAGAELSWTPLSPEFEGIGFPRDLDHARVRSVSAWTRSDAAGRFAFGEIPEGARAGASVVWVTTEGRAAAAVRLELPDDSWDGWGWPGRIEAPVRQAGRALVLCAREPVAHARVRHLLDFWSPGLPEPERQARRVFLRETESGPDGRVTIVPGAGANALQAFAGEDRSLLWIGDPGPGDVRLELWPSFRLSGSVLVDAPGFGFEGVRCNVGYYGKPDRSDLEFAEGSIPLRSDGSFGPDTWPRADRAHLLVRVSRGEVVPAETVLPVPEKGAEAYVELRSTIGNRLEVRTMDREGAPLPGASVRAGQWTGTSWLALGNETTDEQGALELRGLPAGQLLLEVVKPGFTSQTLEDHRVFLPRREEGPLHVFLSRAGTVAGFVHRGSEPVEQFTLVVWTDDLTYQPLLDVRDEEGAFRLEDAPVGETVHLFAFNAELPQSESASVVPGDEPLEVVLELPTPRRARGRVIDSLTGEPLATATVQHTTSGMKGAATYRGVEMPVRADGTFELGGFFPGRGGFAISAAGFEPLYFSTRQDDVEVLDLGLLALNPLARLDLRVREEGVDDYSCYRAWNQASDDRRPVPLGSDGTLSLVSRSGAYLVNLSRPDGTLVSRGGVVLPGQTQTVEFELSGGIQLLARLVAPPRTGERLLLTAYCRGADGEERIESGWSAERQGFLLHGLQPGDVVLELRDGAGRLLAQRSVRLPDEPAQTVLLEPRGTRHRVRFEDERGRPRAPGSVHVSLGDSSGWVASYDLDASGEFELGPLAETRAVLSVRFDSEFIAWGIPVELEPEGTTTVRVEAGERSYLRLVEEGRPCQGVHVAYSHPQAPRSLEFTYISDESGLVRGPLCRRTPYRVRIHHQRYWPMLHEVEPRGVAAPGALELRSRSALEFQVGGALPLAGARLELVHEELGESAASWREAGLIEASPGLQSDVDGRIVLEGVPRGSYSWTILASDGRSAAGELALGGARETIAVRLEP